MQQGLLTATYPEGNGRNEPAIRRFLLNENDHRHSLSAQTRLYSMVEGMIQHRLTLISTVKAAHADALYWD